MENTVIYPGTFDPITNGHLDLIGRASALFNHVIVAVASNASKKPAFTLEKRVALAKEVVSAFDNVDVFDFDILLVNFAEQKGANIILRGLRAMSDFEYEFQLASMNKSLSEGIESIFLTPSSTTMHISSTLVREIASLQGDVSPFVPTIVNHSLIERYRV